MAALAIVFLHATSMAERFGFKDIAWLNAGWGRWGVDLFFVISGFIMFSVTERNGAGFRCALSFWLKRFIRIAPLYWVLTTITILIALAAPGLTEYRWTSAHAIASYFFIPWLDWRGGAAPPLRVGWSLNFEAYFYLVFGFLLMFNRQRLNTFVAAWVAGAIGIGLWLHPQQAIAAMATSTLLLEFAAGVYVGSLWSRGLFLKPPAAAAFVLLGAAALGYADYTALAVDEVLKFGFPCLLIFVGLISLERSKSFAFASPVMLKIGDWSYSIYLTHLLSLGLFGRIYRLLHCPPPAILVLAQMGLVVLIAACTYRWLEQPMHLWLSRRLHIR